MNTSFSWTPHRVLATLAVAIAGLGGLISITDPTALGIDSDTWTIIGNWMSFGAGLVGVAITVVRAATDAPPATEP